jgi:hypothetical protein
MPSEDPRLIWVGAPSELVVAEDDVRVLEHPRVSRRGLEQDRRLLLRGGSTVDGGVLDRHEVMEGDDRQQMSLPLSTREKCHELALWSGRGLGDPLLEALQLEPALGGEPDQLGELDAVAVLTVLSVGIASVVFEPSLRWEWE